MAGFVEFAGARFYFGLGEFADCFLQQLLIFGELQIHVNSSRTPAERSENYCSSATADFFAEAKRFYAWARRAQRLPYSVSAKASLKRLYVVASVSGCTRVSAVTVIKLASPTQRGNACRCKCPVTPAPAARPKFIP